MKTAGKASSKKVLLVANGDLRLSANQSCWAAQCEMEESLAAAVRSAGYSIIRAHPFKPAEGHGFISSQKEGMSVFSGIDPAAKLVVAEAVWQYSHHILAGLISHRGPILLVANWSGQWPGLVGMLNLAGSLAKAGVKYSSLWAEDFSDDKFRRQLAGWLKTGSVRHDLSHVRPLRAGRVPARERRIGESLARELKRNKAIMGIFDEGCMGMFNAIIPDSLLNPVGLFKERLSQSALYYAATQVSDAEARAVYRWLVRKGMRFAFGHDKRRDLTLNQVLGQCKTYIAAVRIADEFGCDTIGIQ